jgi:hypothetical protein
MKRRYWILAALLLALLSGPACALGGILEGAGWGQSPDGRRVDSPVQSVPTLYPTLTPTPSRTTPSPSDDRAFRLEMTEADLAEFIGTRVSPSMVSEFETCRCGSPSRM